MALAPEIVEFLRARAASGLPEVWEAPVAELRANTYGRVALAGTPEPIFSVANRFIPGPTADLPIRIYRPGGDSPRPALVYFHGGGWVLNFLDIYDAALHALANQSGSVILAVSYQKAPEHPFPAPFDDCYAALLWAHGRAEELGIDRARLGVGGDSAGGNLAAAVALQARDAGGPRLAYQLLLYPCTERAFDTESYRTHAWGYGLSTKAMIWFWEQYLQGAAHDRHPYACPAAAKDFRNLPPVILATAQYDPLRDDGRKYAALLQSAGVKTHYRDYEGMIHGFMTMGKVTPRAQVLIQDCAAIIRTLTAR